MSVFSSLQRLDGILNLRSTSDDIAIINANTNDKATYRDLSLMAARTAKTLKAAGCGRGDNILVITQKSIEAIAATFGVLSVDACYIPLDVTIPIQRLQTIASETKPACILTDDSSSLVLSLKQFGHPIFRITSMSEGYELINLTVDTNNCIIHRENQILDTDLLAYTIYTSGSTGNPKGVQILHESVIAFLKSAQEIACYEKPKFLNTSPLFFDASILDIYCTLALGGTLVLLDNIIFPSQLTETIKRYRISDTLMVSSLLKLLTHKLSNMNVDNMASLKSIWYGAEPCPTSVLKKISACAPNIHFIHGYGPTEATHSTTIFSCRNIMHFDLPYLPIGKPLATVKTIIVDDNFNSVQPRNIGELLVGGKQLMKGYLNDPERTQAAIIKLHGKHFYKTGDYVKELPDGNLIFIGRKDDAVKIRGNLVYLSEVENTAILHKNILDAHAFAYSCENKVYDTEIALFLFGEQGFCDEGAIHDHLAIYLPNYMLPSKIIFPEESQCRYFPSGKLDKKHLLASFFNGRV